MHQLFRVFVNICLLRVGPQQLPASRFLLLLALGAHAGLGTLFALFTLPLPQSLLAGVLGSAVLFAVLQGLLLVYRKPHRLTQAVTALAGAEVTLGLLALPVTVWFYAVDSDNARVVPSLLSLLLIMWNVAVAAHVLRHALAVNQWSAALWAFAYTVLAYNAAALVT